MADEEELRLNRHASKLTSKAALGFSLIETAIVLGVVGLVIGGIWIGAAEVNYRHKLNQTVQGIGILVNDFRNVYKAMTPSNIACGAVWVNTKIFPNSPPGWKLSNSSYPQDPWGKDIYIRPVAKVGAVSGFPKAA